MNRKLNIWILFICSSLVLAFVVGVGLPAYRHIRKFFVEDSIHSTFYPVTAALYKYQGEQGRPAESLTALMPKYLGAIPSSHLADLPTYRILPDGKSWELAIHSRALPEPRIYLCRSTQQFTPEEKSRIILEYHVTWTVFPADR